jgi:hypothetical protein
MTFSDGSPSIKIDTALLRTMFRLLVNSNVVPRSLIPVTLIMEVIRSSETFFLTGTLQLNVPEDGILENKEKFTVLFPSESN